MRNWFLALSCAALVTLTNGIAQADVEGQSFDVTVQSNVIGDFSGVLDFLSQGLWTLDVDDVEEDITGSYEQSGGALAIITGEADGEEVDIATFVAISFDPKQLPGILGSVARRNNVPAQIQGRGVNTADEAFTFSGTEILVTEN